MIDFTLIINALPALLHGAWVTIQIAALSCIIGLTLGTALGIALASKNNVFRYLASIYTTFMRGTPMLIQILFAFYVLPQLGLTIPPFWTAIIAIGLNSSAYIAHIIKSGITSIGKGQIEAAKVLGLGTGQITQYIVLPQAIRVVLPALGNEFITLVKDSSLASIIGVVELTKEGDFIKSRTFDVISTYTAVALIYLVLTSAISLLVTYAEKRMDHHAQH